MPAALVEKKKGTVQIPVDSLFAQTQRYARFRQINCSLLWHRFERCQKKHVFEQVVATVNNRFDENFPE